MEKLLTKIVTDFGTKSYNVDMGIDIRAEVEDMEKEIDSIRARINERKKVAIELGLATISIGKAPELSPTGKMYIELHGQEAFDKVKRIGKAPERFTWIA
jgi:hypothetical protein